MTCDLITKKYESPASFLHRLIPYSKQNTSRVNKTRKTTATGRFQITGKILKLYCSAWQIGDDTIISYVVKAGTMTIQTIHILTSHSLE